MVRVRSAVVRALLSELVPRGLFLDPGDGGSGGGSRAGAGGGSGGGGAGAAAVLEVAAAVLVVVAVVVALADRASSVHCSRRISTSWLLEHGPTGVRGHARGREGGEDRGASGVRFHLASKALLWVSTSSRLGKGMCGWVRAAPR